MKLRFLTPQNYKSYGSVISAHGPSVSANMGTAKRFNHLTKVANLRPKRAKLNVCLFRCRPHRKFPITIKLLERHPFSTQVFIPMTGAKRYLVVVSLGKEKPDLNSLSAFIATGSQGISYKPGVWHHPLIALDKPTDFGCLIWENGTKEDCQVVKLKNPILIRIP
ncbi:MAG: ureidoglycolate lyase [Elusimicrobia bacterium]|nr:ureidoglycolate lyase [Elusimicrobiota bacterium]